MIPALETAGFFLAIAAALRFSSWAEGWLSPNLQPIKERAPDAPSSVASEGYGPHIVQEPFKAA